MSWRERLKKIDFEYIRRGAERIDRADLERLLARAEEITDRFAREHGLERYYNDARLLVDMLSDYYKGSYRHVPWWAIAAVVFSLLYVLNPFDLIPDFLPVIGIADDIAVVAVLLKMIERELEHYRRWKTGGS